jgi:hypothetical protein
VPTTMTADMEKAPTQTPNDVPAVPSHPQHHSLFHALTHHNTHPQIENLAYDAFLGRLGGNQRFASTPTPTPDGTVSQETPADSIRDATWRTILSTKDFRNTRLWKLAAIEGVGTGLQVYISGILALGILPTATETSIGAVFPVILASIVQIFMIALFVCKYFHLFYL